ncbi:MAG: YceD family protein [Arthrobacter sp.]|jgi:uncharacterized protein|nr:YceD family protein [Arthrobacter sp.]
MAEKAHKTALDRSSAWVFDVRDLARAAGIMREETGKLPAPAELGVALIGVQEGSDVELDLRLEAVHEGVLVTGTATVHVTGECGRCLDPIAYDLETDLQELFYLSENLPEAEEDVEQYVVVDDLIDLEPLLRDAVVTALPFQPVCREECEGLCPQCGVRLDENPGHHHEVVDPRWAALMGLAGSSAETAEGTKSNEMEER